MKVTIFTKNTDNLPTALGISDDRTAQLIENIDQLIDSTPGQTQADHLPIIGDMSLTENELAFAVYYYSGKAAEVRRKQERGRARAFSMGDALMEALKRSVMPDGHKQQEQPDADSMEAGLVDVIFGKGSSERIDMQRREKWRNGKLTCTCAGCSRIRTEMETMHAGQ